jgi:cation:H+ antiporter
MDWLTLVLFVLGFFALIFGADTLVKGASRLAASLQISPLIIGLTVVAFGTSAPELAINLQAAYEGRPGLAVGNVIGSNIANILLILGVAAVITPLAVSYQLLKQDVPLMIGASILLILLALDGMLGRLDGLLLFTGIIVYTTYVIIKGRREGASMDDLDLDLDAQSGGLHFAKQSGLIVLGLILLTVGAQWLVNGAVMMATVMNVSELIIGLTIVAIGTSLPELATSVAASLHGKTDMAVGNVVGSNLFNILSVLGLSALVAPAGIVVEAVALAFDLPVMLAVAIATLPIFFTGYRIERWEGWLFLGYYCAYLAYLVLYASGHVFLPIFTTAMVFFVIPLTVLTLLILVWRHARVKNAFR